MLRVARTVRPTPCNRPAPLHRAAPRATGPTVNLSRTPSSTARRSPARANARVRALVQHARPRRPTAANSFRWRSHSSFRARLAAMVDVPAPWTAAHRPPLIGPRSFNTIFFRIASIRTLGKKRLIVFFVTRQILIKCLNPISPMDLFIRRFSTSPRCCLN